MGEVKRPEWPYWLSHNEPNNRAFERACNAWRLASLANPQPTEDDVAAATGLLRRLTGLSRAYYRHEVARCNGTRTAAEREAHEEEGIRIEGRGARLDDELARYGLFIVYDEFYIGLKDAKGNRPVEVLV